MGWTYFHKDPEVKAIDVLKNVWSSRCKVLDSAKVGSEVYQLVEVAESGKQIDNYYEKDENGKYRFIAVFFTDNKPNEHCNFGYKTMDETVGPYAYNCPKRILDRASKLRDTRYAQDFRDRCYAKHERRKKLPKVGQRIRLAEPLQFSNGQHYQEFKVVPHGKKGTGKAYEANTGLRCKIPNLAEYEFEIIE